MKVGAMYRIKDHPTDPGRTFCHGNGHYVYVSPAPWVSFHKSIGTKMVYLGTIAHGHEPGVWSKWFKKNTERIGLFGDKVLSIEPEAWRHIEPMEDE